MRSHPLALALSLALIVTPTRAADGDSHEYRLGNGLKLIVREDHRAPVVVSQVWYKIGAGYETDGSTGLSHLLEHLMFKGTPAHPNGEFSRIIAVNGGRENAFTGRDYTSYFQTMASDRLAVSFELEADRMRNLGFDQAEFEKERKVVMEERRLRTDDNPQAALYEQFNATAFTRGPAHHPVIGWMDDLEHLTLEDARNWYARWYAPNNATLVVVGDIAPDAVRKLAEHWFGALKNSDIAATKPRNTTAQRGERRITMKLPAQLPYLMLGYHVPVLRDLPQSHEPYALEVLAGILGAGKSARLERDLVRGAQLVAAASVGYELYSRQGAQFMLDATPATGKGVAEVEKALRAQIARLRDEPVAQDELERIKAQVVASRVFERDSMFYQAMQIGQLETVGLDWRVNDDYVTRVRAVTPEQLRAVAQKYLIEDTLTVAVLDPQPMSAAQAARPMQGGNGHVH
jgi:zinc protease